VLRTSFEQHAPEPIIEALVPFVRPERHERLVDVIGKRLSAVTLLMDAPHDPHNGAAVMRSCDAFGVQHLHVIERNEPFRASNAVASGTERWVDVIAHETVADAVQVLRASEHTLIGTHPDGELTPPQLAEIPRVALVMGNEHDGICEQLAASCSAHVRVPMRGFVESLNVSVTAAILLCSATHQRPGDLEDSAKKKLLARWLVLSLPRALDILAAKGIILPLAARLGTQ